MARQEAQRGTHAEVSRAGSGQHGEVTVETAGLTVSAMSRAAGKPAVLANCGDLDDHNLPGSSRHRFPQRVASSFFAFSPGYSEAEHNASRIAEAVLVTCGRACEPGGQCIE